MTAISVKAFQRQALPLKSILIAQQLVLLPLYFFVPLWILLINTIAATAVLYSIYHPNFQINKWLKVAITMLAILSILFVFRKFSGRDAGIALISVMYGLKILETKTRRDAILLLGLGFFLIVAGFLFTQKPMIALYQFVPVIAILNAYLSLYSISSQENSQASIKSVLKKLSRYLLIALPVMFLLFVFFPRLGGPLWRMPGSSTATSGISDSMNFSDISSLQLSDNLAFRVKFNDKVPSRNNLYWRVLALDNFDGLSWTRGGRAPMSDHKNINEYKDRVDYDITLEPTKMNFLVTLDRPLITPNTAQLIDDYTVYSQFRVLDRTRYSMTSLPSLAIGKNLKEPLKNFYTKLPNGNNQSKAWAKNLRESVASDKDFIQEVLQHINQQPFFYTLTPDILDEQLMDSFWFDKRTGFCEHYSSAFVFMARAAGIPARIVVGYHGGEKNPLSDYWIIRDADAHAWTEVWFEDQGWVRFDPTSAIAPHRVEEALRNEYNWRDTLFDGVQVIDIENIGMLKTIQYWMDNFNTQWNDWVLDYNRDKQSDFFKGWGFSSINKTQLLLGIALIIITFIGISSLRWFHVRKKTDKLTQAFEIFCRKLNKQSEFYFGKDAESLSNSGPETLIHYLQKKQPENYQKKILLLQSYIAYRYAEKDISSQELSELINGLKS